MTKARRRNGEECCAQEQSATIFGLTAVLSSKQLPGSESGVG